MTPAKPERCPCGSGRPYDDCCAWCHQGHPAGSPEALMRSRFSAYVLEDEAYLLASWHSSTRPPALGLGRSTGASPDWTALEIVSATAPDVSANTGRGHVHFRAIHRTASGWGYLEEQSEFVKEGEHWYYLCGETQEGVFKPQRNAKCPCGSGRKYKTCCL